MTPASRVEELAAALDSPRAAAALDDELRAFLELAASVRSVESARTPLEFRESLRDRLMSEALAAQARPAPRISPPQPAAPTRSITSLLSRGVAAAVAGFIVLALFGSATLRAVPGDLLYGVKRQAEAIELMTARGQLARGHALLARASRRLDEVRSLARERDLGRVPNTMADMDRATSRGSALLSFVASETKQIGPLADLEAFTVRQQRALAAITTLLGPAERQRADQSARLLDTIQASTSEAIAELTCGAGCAPAVQQPAAPAGDPAPSAGPSGAPGAPSGGGQQSGPPSAPADGSNAVTPSVPAVPGMPAPPALPADRAPSAPAVAPQDIVDADTGAGAGSEPTSGATPVLPGVPSQPALPTSPVVPPALSSRGVIVPPALPPPPAPAPTAGSQTSIVVTTPPRPAPLPNATVVVTPTALPTGPVLPGRH